MLNNHYKDIKMTTKDSVAQLIVYLLIFGTALASIYCFIKLAKKKNRSDEIKGSKVRFLLFFLSNVAIIYILYLGFTIYSSPFKWAPYYEPSGFQFVGLLILAPAIFIIGLFNSFLARKLHLTDFTLKMPYLISLWNMVLQIPFLSSSPGFIACWIGITLTCISGMLIIINFFKELIFIFSIKRTVTRK